MPLIRSSVVIAEPAAAPAAPLYEYRDASGATWQMTESYAARRPGLVRGEPIPVPVRRPRLAAEVAPSAEDARQVGDATKA